MAKQKHRAPLRTFPIAPPPAAETPLLHLSEGEVAATPAAATASPQRGWLSFGRRHYNAQGELISDAAV